MRGCRSFTNFLVNYRDPRITPGPFHMNQDQTWTTHVGKQEITFKSGKLAEQAGAAITATAGETVVLATATIAPEAKEGLDYLPFLVDFEEKFYAAGKINGSRFIKREGRPSENAVLTSRLIDRPLRPLFPKTFRRDIQVIVTVLSLDNENDPDVLAINAASAALMKATGSPFKGPVGAVRVGRLDGQFVANPTKTEMLKSDLDLIVAGTRERIMMVEAGANEVADQDVFEAMKFALQSIQSCLETQEQMRSDNVVETSLEENVAAAALELVKSKYHSDIQAVSKNTNRNERDHELFVLKSKILEELEGEMKQIDIAQAVETLYLKSVRNNILADSHRSDGRGIEEVREISAEVGILPRPHGSSLFKRGLTQVLGIVTLGGPSEKQLVDTMDEEGSKRYMHHYNFPPYSTGEVSPMRGVGRREIGHGALAERALLPVIPSEEEFPYTIRVVSEVMSSDGSTSMGSTCASTLSLMDAGVPLKKPVSGIAMGLVTNEDASEFKVLTDLLGLEDFAGDMDFKITGTADGITAMQMDTKIAGLTMEIVEQTMKQAKVGRLHILEEMLKVLPEPRAELSKYAPKITSVKINPEKIGELIGPGGKTINKIIEECGGEEVTQIDIDDSGLVMITSTDQEMAKKAIASVEGITIDVEIGALYEAEIVDFVTTREGNEIGALAQILPGKVGMIHVSEMADGFVKKASDVVKIGQKVQVKVKDVDSARGRIALSIKAAGK